jgi:hypothetical protein
MDKNWFTKCSQVNVYLADGVTRSVLEAAISMLCIYFVFWFSDRILLGRLVTVNFKYSCLFNTKRCGHVLAWNGAGEGVVSFRERDAAKGSRYVQDSLYPVVSLFIFVRS